MTRNIIVILIIAMVGDHPLPAQESRGDEGWFRRIDKNGDGRLTREEAETFPRLKAGFEYFDANRDGGISPEEMKSAMAQWRQRQAEPDEPPATNAPPKRVTTTAPRRPHTVDANSPQFRGPRSDGVAYGTNLPVTWSTTTNVVWSCAIPGKGWSSPVVWGDRVFVTSTVSPGSVEAPPEKLGSMADHIRGVTATDEHQHMLHCVDWQTGKLLWSRCAYKGVPPGSIHPKNSYASETPVTDGERVYAYFGNIGLFCYDMSGRELWSRQWGSFKMDWNWGPAASPALHGDLLFVLNDNQEKSFLVALDKRTGKDVWRVERDEKSNWTTPFIWQNDLRTEIVTSGSGKVRSYDLSGKMLWELRGMSNVTVPTPFAAEGLLYIASGCQHSALRPVYAIRPGASGDISLPADATSNSHIAWVQRRAAPYVTSPLVCDGQLYVLLDKGFLAAYDAQTGEEIYGKQRFTAGKAAFTASPWAYDGKIFCLTETGETYVVEAGPEFRVLHVNRLDEATLATPAVARDSLILRTLTKLYRIASTMPAVSAKPASLSAEGFVPDAPFVGEVNGSYIDPEFSESASQVVFQDMQNRVWIGDIDPETGLFKTASGRDYLMDENITLIFDRPPQGRKFSTNGPEWTHDEKGHLVVYTKEDAAGIMQQWAARLVEGKPIVTQLTRQPYDCYGNMPSRFQDGKAPRVAYTHDWPIWKAKAAWIFLDQPNAPRELVNFDYRQMSMWSAVSPGFLFVQKPPGAPHGQIAVSDAETGAVTVLTGDAGEKNDPGLFKAPEFGGEILLVCNVENSALAIYRDEKRDGTSPWKRIATLTLPEDAPYKYISSPETIASATGVGGVSCFSLLAREGKDRNTPGGIWVLGLGKDPNRRFARRVDDGASSVVLEPEPFVGKHEVYVYYNAFNAVTRENGLRRAATGIKVDSVPLPPANPAAATNSMFQRIEIAALTDTPVAVNGFAIADLNRDGLVDIVAARQVRTSFFVSAGGELSQDQLDVLINRGNLKFEPHPIAISGSDLTQEKFDVSAEIPNLADFNGDGFLDIFVTRSGGARYQKHGNTLLLSDGGWDTFRDVSAAMGVQNLDGYNRQSSIADVNADGWLDIAIGCDTIGRPDRFGAPHSRLFVFQPGGDRFADGKFADIAGTLGLEQFGGYSGDPAKDKAGPGISLRDLDNDGDFDLVQTFHADMTGAMQHEREAAANYDQGVWVWKNLLRETGEFRFQRVTGNGLAEYASLKWNPEAERYDATAVGSGLPYLAWADVDNDGLLDALAAGPNSPFWAPRAEYTGGRFWRNLGGFRFQQDTAGAGFASLDWTYQQIYVHNGWELPPRLRDTSPRTVRVPPGSRPDHGNKQPGIPLHGPGGNHPYFADVIFGDFDNDGRQDVVVLDRSEHPGQNTYALFFHNERGHFRLLKTAETGLDAGGISGEAADLNADGWLDLVFAADPMNSAGGRQPDPERFRSKVFLNNGATGSEPNHWLHLTFAGIKDAELIGARVEVSTKSAIRNPKSEIFQSRWIHSNHSYKSGGALDAHFGLGEATSADVKVTLLNGKTRTFTSLAADKSHKLKLATP